MTSSSSVTTRHSSSKLGSALAAPSVRTSAIQTSLMALGLSSVETVFELSHSRFLSCKHAQRLCKVSAEAEFTQTMPSRSQSSAKPQLCKVSAEAEFTQTMPSRSQSSAKPQLCKVSAEAEFTQTMPSRSQSRISQARGKKRPSDGATSEEAEFTQIIPSRERARRSQALEHFLECL